jgi:tRNA (guanine37-N1)-methyltransferase
MQIDILTLFPETFESPLKVGLLGKAREKGLVHITVHALRDFALDKHRVTDDYPYGGGAGMVMKPEPIIRSIEKIRAHDPETWVILLTPQGRVFGQAEAQRLARREHLQLICGRYEGVDERVRHFTNEELSIGDYIVMGGEVAALVVTEAICRLVPGVLGEPRSVTEESFSQGLLKYPQYTRPQKFRDFEVPLILLSGNHQAIEQWRHRESLKKTLQMRPDLLEKETLSEKDRAVLKEIQELKDNRGESYERDRPD